MPAARCTSGPPTASCSARYTTAATSATTWPAAAAPSPTAPAATACGSSTSSATWSSCARPAPASPSACISGSGPRPEPGGAPGVRGRPAPLAAALAVVPRAARDGRDGLLQGVVARQPVGQARDPQRLGVAVPGASEGQDPIPGRELLPVPDDDGQRAGVHEIDGGEVKDDAVGIMPRAGQILVELTAGHGVQLAADRHDRDRAVTVRRQSESLHAYPPDGRHPEQHSTRAIVYAETMFLASPACVRAGGEPAASWRMVIGRPGHRGRAPHRR